MIIYRVQNVLNNKCYIGFTSRNVEERWREHCHDALTRVGQCRKFHAAIRKYGVHVWVKTVLFESNDKSEALKQETFNITKFNSIENGYNITFGGEIGTLGLKMPCSFGEKISERQKGKNNPCYGKTYSVEERLQHSERLKKWHKNNKHPRKGKTATEQTKTLMSKAATGDKNHFFGKKHKPETIKHLSDNNPMREKWGWMNPCTARNILAMQIYSKADKYYKNWLDCGKKGADVICNMNCEKKRRPHLNLVQKFKSGWIPEKDPKWLENFKCATS